METTTLTRFWKKVDKTNSCWYYTTFKNKGGYGVFHVNRKKIPAHRFSYELVNGKIPNGLQIDHICRNRACVNPDHLEAVTQKVNILRGIGYSAINARKTHCKRGHKFTRENTMKNKKGRMCRICFYQSVKRYKQSQKILLI